MKILITGASGFAGSHLVELLEKKGHQIFAPKIDLLNATETANAVSGKMFDGVVHLAAIAFSGGSFAVPGKILKNNILAELNLLEVLRQNKSQPRILLVCSADEYGQGSGRPIKETDPLMPTSPYAVSKIGQDFLGLMHYLAYGMKIIRVRPFNHIGERQMPGFVVPDFAKQIVDIEKSTSNGIIKVGNLNTIRDFTDVKDMMEAYWLALTKGIPGEVYNLGSGKGVEIKEVLKLMIGLSSAQIRIDIDESRFRPGDTPRLICNPQKFRQLTGWKPKIKLSETLQRVLEYFRNN